jgi:hypothetical protein
MSSVPVIRHQPTLTGALPHPDTLRAGSDHPSGRTTMLRSPLRLTQRACRELGTDAGKAQKEALKCRA